MKTEPRITQDGKKVLVLMLGGTPLICPPEPAACHVGGRQVWRRTAQSLLTAGAVRASEGRTFVLTDYGRDRAARKPGFVLNRLDRGPITKDTIGNHITSDDRGCWNWKWGTSADGYARKTSRYHDEQLVSRIVYKEYFGEIGDGLCVCHSCDNPRCINPCHLFLGTKTENTKDRDRKGRFFSKLTKQQADEIKAASPGVRGCDLAQKYGVSKAAIYHIRHGRTWSKA